ncbi:conserved hypothetical protein, partial [Perkinsus marinus ATCC 50983]
RNSYYLIVFSPGSPGEVMKKFKDRQGIPFVIGALDGCHIRLAVKPPSNQNPDVFYCRRGLHSINALFVVSSDLTISYCYPQYGGASHDSYILKCSGLWPAL